MSIDRPCPRRAVTTVAIVLALGCGKADKPRPAMVKWAPVAAGPLDELSAAERARLKQAPLSELAFVPADAEAVMRLDLRSLVQSSGDTTNSVDFLLRAQQPAAWEALKQAGITAGEELAALYLVVGPRGRAADNYLLAGVGRFDPVRLTERLRRRRPIVEPAPAPPGETAALFVWAKASPAALGPVETPPEVGLGAAAVGVADGLILVGPPAFVRRALATRAGRGEDVRATTMARELVALDATSPAWGVAVVPADPAAASLPTLIPGLRRARFYTALAAPGPEADGLFQLEAEFASRQQAAEFGERLTAALDGLRILGDRSALGRTIQRLRANAKVQIEDTVLVATGAL